MRNDKPGVLTLEMLKPRYVSLTAQISMYFSADECVIAAFLRTAWPKKGGTRGFRGSRQDLGILYR